MNEVSSFCIGSCGTGNLSLNPVHPSFGLNGEPGHIVYDYPEGFNLTNATLASSASAGSFLHKLLRPRRLLQVPALPRQSATSQRSLLPVCETSTTLLMSSIMFKITVISQSMPPVLMPHITTVSRNTMYITSTATKSRKLRTRPLQQLCLANVLS